MAGPPDQGISDAECPDPASPPASARATGGKTSIEDTDRSRPRSTPRGTPPRQACALGDESSPPLERLGQRPPGRWLQRSRACLQQIRQQLAASRGAVRHVEQLGSRLIDPLDDPLDRRLDSHGNDRASVPALHSTLPARRSAVSGRAAPATSVHHRAPMRADVQDLATRSTDLRSGQQSFHARRQLDLPPVLPQARMLPANWRGARRECQLIAVLFFSLSCPIRRGSVVGMWESRVSEISKSLWKPFSGFRGRRHFHSRLCGFLTCYAASGEDAKTSRHAAACRHSLTRR